MALPPATSNTEPFMTFSINGPNSSILNSIVHSLNSEFGATRIGTAAASVEATTAAEAETMAANPAVTTNSPSAATTLATVTSNIQVNASATETAPTNIAGVSDAIPTTAGASGTAAATATNVASDPGFGALARQGRCSRISCSPGLQAAVAVPVGVAVLAGIALLLFCIRRRWKNRRDDGAVKKKLGKKWTRHLRLFSFDAELLVGGRFSSTNSTESGQNSADSAQPSIHSLEEVAPPYCDAINQAQSAMTQTSSVPFAAFAAAFRDPGRTCDAKQGPAQCLSPALRTLHTCEPPSAESMS